MEFEKFAFKYKWRAIKHYRQKKKHQKDMTSKIDDLPPIGRKIQKTETSRIIIIQDLTLVAEKGVVITTIITDLKELVEVTLGLK